MYWHLLFRNRRSFLPFSNRFILYFALFAFGMKREFPTIRLIIPHIIELIGSFDLSWGYCLFIFFQILHDLSGVQPFILLLNFLFFNWSCLFWKRQWGNSNSCWFWLFHLYFRFIHKIYLLLFFSRLNLERISRVFHQFFLQSLFQGTWHCIQLLYHFFCLFITITWRYCWLPF